MMTESMRSAEAPENSTAAALKLQVPIGHDAIRTALQEWRCWADRACVGPDLAGRAEIVLAEVLNNITEHGHAGLDTIAAKVVLYCRLQSEGLRMVVIDHGLPVPQGLCVPQAHPFEGDGGIANLPEGGFGWHLIRELTCELDLRSDALGNRLCFLVPLHQGDHAAGPQATGPRTPLS